MKRWIWVVGGMCAAAAGILVWRTVGGQRRAPHVEDLAWELEDDWADDPTFV